MAVVQFHIVIFALLHRQWCADDFIAKDYCVADIASLRIRVNGSRVIGEQLGTTIDFADEQREFSLAEASEYVLACFWCFEVPSINIHEPRNIVMADGVQLVFDTILQSCASIIQTTNIPDIP